ncbi:MAG: hypothetical protein LBU39_03815 [Desulfobulbaceae bacterium]|jgi:hypothetical protein|nr:hypothetical protein [Desulfobulbaceae bacterium]
MIAIYDRITWLFDPLHHLWEHEKMNRKISVALIFFFLAGLALIELNRFTFLPPWLAAITPNNHFRAVQFAFSVVLLQEVISLIFTIPCSFSRSVGKQFEILALILLRNAFKELAAFPEPIVFIGNEMAVLRILSDGFGALFLFTLLGFYYRIQPKGGEGKLAAVALYQFVAAKKGIALVLLAIFVIMGARNGWLMMMDRHGEEFLHSFYTILILTDILLVLLAQCFQPTFYAVFRNSGFALSTLIIRLTLAAPPFYNVSLGLAAVLFAIFLSQASNILFQKKSDISP